MVSYFGFIQHSDSYNYYLKRIKPFVKIRRMKGMIGCAERAKRKLSTVGACRKPDGWERGADSIGRPSDGQ
ncbi:hypothetical protein AGMMS49992_10730 [Clostridia bacterium]|nr:hypothetical protein AGMMS49992_10730 [Clostridia bacterium]